MQRLNQFSMETQLAFAPTATYLHGDATLIQLVRDARPSGRSDEHPGWRRFSVVLSWIGVATMVLFGRPVPRSA
jgi:hypothetical protein